MKTKYLSAVVMFTGGLALLGAAAVQDKYTLQIPQGLAFTDFNGYESWQVVSVSHPAGDAAMSGETLNIIVANPVMIAAYASGIPGNGKPWPDGAKAAKLQYIPKKSAQAPFPVAIPDTLKDVAFMAKDNKRFADSGGWGYGMFNYDATTKTFTPDGTGAKCGAACHTIAKAQDYVFTAYAVR